MYWPETISNTRLHQATKQQHLCLILKKWTWHGHVNRMNNNLPAKTALTWIPEGNRKRGRLKTMWQRTMEEELKVAGLTWGTAARRAQDRGVWRDLVHSSKESPRQRGLARSCAQQQGEPKTEGSGEILCTAARRAQDRGVWRDLVHSIKESPRQRGLARFCASLMCHMA